MVIELYFVPSCWFCSVGQFLLVSDSEDLFIFTKEKLNTFTECYFFLYMMFVLYFVRISN